MAAKIFNGMNNKRGQGSSMTIKADMEKVYDCVE